MLGNALSQCCGGWFFLHGWHLYVVLRAAEVSLALVVVSTSLLLVLVVVSTCVWDVGRFVQFVFNFYKFVFANCTASADAG